MAVLANSIAVELWRKRTALVGEASTSDPSPAPERAWAEQLAAYRPHTPSASRYGANSSRSIARTRINRVRTVIGLM